MTFLGDAWIILIPFGIFVIIKILNFSRVMLPVNAKHELGAKEVITSSLISTIGLAAAFKTTGLSPINGLKTIANYFRYSLVLPPLETTAETAQTAELAPLLSSGETAMLTTVG